MKIAPTDLRILLSYYGVTDKRRVDSLVAMARAARRDSWADLRAIHSHEWLTYLGFEASAHSIKNYEVLYVPGLLQIEEYALATYANAGIDRDRAEQLWDGRLRRQELHEVDDSPDMQFILDEAVVRRAVGGPDVFRRQCERLLELGERDHVTLQVLPFAAGEYSRMGRAFILLEFPDALDDDVVYLENDEGDTVTRDDPEVTVRYADAFYRQQDKALSVEDTRHLLEELARNGAHRGEAPAGVGEPS